MIRKLSLGSRFLSPLGLLFSFPAPLSGGLSPSMAAGGYTQRPSSMRRGFTERNHEGCWKRLECGVVLLTLKTVTVATLHAYACSSTCVQSKNALKCLEVSHAARSWAQLGQLLAERSEVTTQAH